MQPGVLLFIDLSCLAGSASRARHHEELFHHSPPFPPSNTLHDSRRFMVAFSNPAAAIEVTNSSMLSIYQPHRSKGSYMLPKSQRFPHEQQPSKQLQQPYQQLQQSYQQLQHQYQQLQQPYPQLQPQRTWTAGPRLDYDDSTTRDPAIPDNPEGLKNPSLLVGPWEEEPTVRITDAVFR